MLKAKLDQAKKDDLRTNHFTIGGPSAAIKKSSSMVQFVPASVQQRVECRPTLNAEKKADLRASHWSLGPNTPVCTDRSRARPTTANPFVTQDMVNFRWVQPVPRLYIK